MLTTEDIQNLIEAMKEEFPTKVEFAALREDVNEIREDLTSLEGKVDGIADVINAFPPKEDVETLVAEHKHIKTILRTQLQAEI